MFKTYLLSAVFLMLSLQGYAQTADTFNKKKDLLLVHCDVKTDADDIHVLAALRTLLTNPEYKDVRYLPVVGTYGTQKGLYVPPNSLCKLAYGRHWSDNHNKPKKALKKALKLATKTIKKGGHIWIAEAGQSDFSALLIKALLKKYPDLDTPKRIHIYQHSNWNEKVTTPADLAYVKEMADYHKLPDGNALNNGTPGYRTPDNIDWKKYVKDKHLIQVWTLALEIGKEYDGKDGRYLNKAVSAGGLDFSDMVEVTTILGIDNAPNVESFFKQYGY